MGYLPPEDAHMIFNVYAYRHLLIHPDPEVRIQHWNQIVFPYWKQREPKLQHLSLVIWTPESQADLYREYYPEAEYHHEEGEELWKSFYQAQEIDTRLKLVIFDHPWVSGEEDFHWRSLHGNKIYLIWMLPRAPLHVLRIISMYNSFHFCLHYPADSEEMMMVASALQNQNNQKRIKSKRKYLQVETGWGQHPLEPHLPYQFATYACDFHWTPLSPEDLEDLEDPVYRFDLQLEEELAYSQGFGFSPQEPCRLFGDLTSNHWLNRYFTDYKPETAEAQLRRELTQDLMGIGLESTPAHGLTDEEWEMGWQAAQREI